MQRLFFLLPVPFILGSCSMLEKAAGTPMDPNNPEGPSVADGIVSTAAGTMSAINPLMGGVAAAALISGWATWKAKQGGET